MVVRDVKRQLVSMLLWSLGFLFMIIGGMTEFSALGDLEGSLNQAIESFPKIIRVLYGMEGMDLGTLTGYVGLLLFYVLIMAAIHGVFLGSSLIQREWKEKTEDFLFVKPWTRSSLLGGKFLSGLLVILILESVIGLSFFGILEPRDKMDLWSMIMLSSISTHLVFYLLGFALTIMLEKTWGSRVGLLMVLMSYFLTLLFQLLERPFIKLLSPLAYFSGDYLSKDLGEVLLYPLLLILICVMLLFFGLKVFEKRDL